MPKPRANLTPDQFVNALVSGVPLMDVRAPVEFNAGAFPSALNKPLLDNQQRHLVGAEYANNGQPAAIELGLQLATPLIREQRLDSWQGFVKDNPEGYLYCFRGGLRSKISQQWLADAGLDYPLIEGGYKALRRCLLAELDRLCTRGNIIVLGGATGVGKTELIQQHHSSIDLEGRALHRGSAFGKLFVEQPAQIDWENQIIIDWLRAEASSDVPVLVEAESTQIGKIHVSKPLRDAMTAAPRVTLVAPIEERTQRIFSDYVTTKLRHYQRHVTDAWQALETDVLDNLIRIRNRLGGARFALLRDLLPSAVCELRDRENCEKFHLIIDVLLREYYDPLYQYHADKRRKQVVYEGDISHLKQWLSRLELSAA